MWSLSHQEFMCLFIITPPSGRSFQRSALPKNRYPGSQLASLDSSFVFAAMAYTDLSKTFRSVRGNMNLRLVAAALGQLFGCALFVLVSATTQASNKALIVEFVNEAVDAHPLMAEARARTQAMRELAMAAARSFENPEIEIEAEESEETLWGIGIAKTFDLSRERSAREVVALHERMASEADFDHVRLNLAKELIQGLGNYQTSRSRVSLSERRNLAMTEFANLAERRHSTGDLSLIELDLALLAEAHARMNHATVSVQLAQAREELRSQTSTRQLENQWPMMKLEFPEPQGDEALMSLLQELPEVRRAMRRVDAARAVAELKRRERRPDPRLGFLAGKEGEERLVGLNFSLELPILNTGHHELLAADAELAASQAAADDVVRRARARFTAATQVYGVTLTVWNEWSGLGRMSLDRNAEILARLWNAGEISTSEYLLQMEHVLDLEERALELENAVRMSWLDWLAASGRLGSWLSEHDER